MSKIVFLNNPDTVYDGKFSQIGTNQVRLTFTDEIPTKEVLMSGFNLVNEHNGRVQTKRTDYIYIYRTYEDIPNQIELCNDNNPWVAPKCTVKFTVDFGGTLEGELSQVVAPTSRISCRVPSTESAFNVITSKPRCFR